MIFKYATIDYATLRMLNAHAFIIVFVLLYPEYDFFSWEPRAEERPRRTTHNPRDLIVCGISSYWPRFGRGKNIRRLGNANASLHDESQTNIYVYRSEFNLYVGCTYLSTRFRVNDNHWYVLRKAISHRLTEAYTFRTSRITVVSVAHRTQFHDLKFYMP